MTIRRSVKLDIAHSRHLRIMCNAPTPDTPYSVEDVLAANPGLAALGPVMRSGILIELPVIEGGAPEAPTIRLWN